MTGRYADVGELPSRPPVSGLAGGDGQSIYIAVGGRDSTVVVEITVEPPVNDFVDQIFVRADAGDLSGYRAEVTKLAGRSEPRSSRTAEQAREVYNDAGQLVYVQLNQPLHNTIEKLGLESRPNSPRRHLDGSPPPGYGGSASCPRWRRPNDQRAWLEAWIGVSHRAWPAENLDELIVTLMLAVMTEQQQHTLLTRFVPFVPHDPMLPAKVAAILADAEAVLPHAVEVLANLEQQPVPK